ncbi:unnamed protein product [Trichogramma brassicae]|uniref:Uncharacterized protein n=1 Tax=Trichogramma brassicae TaxID=86971 RepID=A0A6H5INU1_9HYME|nr:unnamed protein product [Trichogramma brassicae]
MKRKKNDNPPLKYTRGDPAREKLQTGPVCVVVHCFDTARRIYRTRWLQRMSSRPAINNVAFSVHARCKDYNDDDELQIYRENPRIIAATTPRFDIMLK